MADVSAKREAKETNELSPKVKKAKGDLECKNGKAENIETDESQNVLTGFETSAVLSDSAREKTIFVHGKVTNSHYYT